MIGSGWEIYNASPLFGFSFPRSITLGGWLAGALLWHFAAMWVLAVNGIVYVVLGLASGRFRRKLLPITPGAVLADTKAALTFRLSHNDLSKYNAVQRLLYVGVTRARRLLRISWSRTRNGNGHSRTPSRFLQPVLPDALRAPANGQRSPRRTRRSALSLHCRSCGRSLTGAAERKIGRHLDCPATYDEHTMALLREWRRQEASDQKLPAYCVFTDATLIAIAEARPRSVPDLIKVQGLGHAKADKYGEHLLAIIATEAERARSSS